MTVEERLSQKLKEIYEKLGEQPWFQELREKWEEIDPDWRRYIKRGVGIGFTLFAFLFLAGTLKEVYDLKNTVAEKIEILSEVRTANKEKGRLNQNFRGSVSGVSWDQYIQNMANRAGLDSGKLVIGVSRAGKVGEKMKESLFDLTLNEVNLKQVVEFAHHLESGGQPVKIRNLKVSTRSAEGFLSAKIYLSAFKVQAESGKK